MRANKIRFLEGLADRFRKATEGASVRDVYEAIGAIVPVAARRQGFGFSLALSTARVGQSRRRSRCNESGKIILVQMKGVDDALRKNFLRRTKPVSKPPLRTPMCRR